MSDICADDISKIAHASIGDLLTAKMIRITDNKQTKYKNIHEADLSLFLIQL